MNTLIFINSQSCFNFCSNKIQLSLHDNFERFTFPILFILFCHIFSEHLAYRFSPANRLLGFHLFNNSNACIKCTYGIFTGSNIPFSFSLFIARKFSRKGHRDNTCLLPSVILACASDSPAPSLQTSTPLPLQPQVEEMTLEQSLVASRAWPPWQHGFKAGMNISYSGSRALQVHVQRW